MRSSAASSRVNSAAASVGLELIGSAGQTMMTEVTAEWVSGNASASAGRVVPRSRTRAASRSASASSSGWRDRTARDVARGGPRTGRALHRRGTSRTGSCRPAGSRSGRQCGSAHRQEGPTFRCRVPGVSTAVVRALKLASPRRASAQSASTMCSAGNVEEPNVRIFPVALRSLSADRVSAMSVLGSGRWT